MTIKYLQPATCTFHDQDDRRQTYPSVAAARAAAEAHVGNRSAAKPFPNEEMYLYGEGDGDCTVTVRQDIDMDAFMGRIS